MNYGEGAEEKHSRYLTNTLRIHGVRLSRYFRTCTEVQGSLADASENNDMRRVLSKLGDAVIVNAAVPGNCPFEHCLGYGWAITEIDESSGIGEMNIGFLFRNQRAAAGAAAEYDGILRFLMNSHGINIQDTKPDGNFVVGKAIWEFE